ncbi:MAG: hypothetical protein MUP17_06520 [candidate division Zixibacteria bacterium]|nr:hypothetical protein [candidate division Zixibacteria bacterium]
MNLKQLLNQGRLRLHKTSKEEIRNLLKVAKRDIDDSQVKGLSSDRKFATAYNAVLQLATILIYCKGYKPYGMGHHFTVFQSIKEILGREYYGLSDYFDSCRAKRNITDYDYAGGISETEAEELIGEAKEFMKVVIRWIKTNYPNLLAGQNKSS